MKSVEVPKFATAVERVRCARPNATLSFLSRKGKVLTSIGLRENNELSIPYPIPNDCFFIVVDKDNDLIEVSFKTLPLPN